MAVLRGIRANLKGPARRISDLQGRGMSGDSELAPNIAFSNSGSTIMKIMKDWVVGLG